MALQDVQTLVGDDSLDQGEGPDVPRIYRTVRGTRLKLGFNFDPTKLDQARPRAIICETEQVDAQEDGENMKVYLIRTREAEDQLLSMSGNGSGQFLVFSGSSTGTSDVSRLKKTSTLSLVVKVTKDFGTWALKTDPAPRLTDDAEALKENPDAFGDRYGTYYVIEEDRLATAYAVLKVRNISEKLRTSFDSGGSMSGSIGLLELSGGHHAFGHLEKAFAKKNVSIEYRVLAEPGNLQVPTISAGGTLDDTLEAVISNLNAYLSDVTADRAVAHRAYVAPLTDFGVGRVWLPWDDARERRIAIVEGNLRRADRELQDLAALKDESDRRRLLFEPEELTQLEGALTPAARKFEELQATLAVLKGSLTEEGQALSIDWTPVLPDWFYDPPTITSRIRGLYGAQVDAVLEERQQNVRRSYVMENANPLAPNIAAQFYVYGRRILTQQLIFENQVGAIKEFRLESGPMAWWRYKKTGTWEARIREEMLEMGPDEGTFLIRLRDRAGRVFDVPLMTARWKVTDGKVRSVNYDVAFYGSDSTLLRPP